MSGAAGGDAPHVVETEFPVRYAETDAMGVVHHAAYLVYFEEGRSQYMRSLGGDYAEVEAGGWRLPVTEAGMRLAGGRRYGERVRVRTWVTEDRPRRLSFAYEIVDPASGAVTGTGTTRHVWTDAAGRPTRRPDGWLRIPGA